MSTNLNILLRAGLIRNEREGRSVRYFADMDGIEGLISFLLEDCCGGNAEQCAPIIEANLQPRQQSNSIVTQSIERTVLMNITIYHNPACGTSRNTLR